MSTHFPTVSDLTRKQLEQLATDLQDKIAALKAAEAGQPAHNISVMPCCPKCGKSEFVHHWHMCNQCCLEFENARA